MLRFLFAQAFLAVLAIGNVNAQGVKEDVARPPTITKVWIETIDDEQPVDQNDEEEIEILREETSQVEEDRHDDSARNLQQFLPYCEGIQTEILCTNLKTNKDCSTELIPYNKNGCYLYLKYSIAITNKGGKDAKITGLTRQLNGQERDFSGMIHQNFILKPRMRINISRTEYVDFCEAHNFIGAGAEVMANVEDQALCVEHGFYVISGDLSL